MRSYTHKFLRSIIVVMLFRLSPAYSQQLTLPKQDDRWLLQPDGSITWNINGRLPHADHIEMSGEKVSLWVAYRVDTSGICHISRTVVFPTFRMLPDDTRSHIAYTFDDNAQPRIYVNDELLRPDVSKDGVEVKAKSINQHGIMRILEQAGNLKLLKIEHSFFP